MGAEYSNLKMAWWAQREGFPPKAPKQIQLIISDLCNQDCSFCAYRMSGYSSNELFMGESDRAAYGHDNPKRFMPKEKALEILEDAKSLAVQGIQFTGGGEPTVHPDHESIFKHALWGPGEMQEGGFSCALVSNGLRWSNELTKMILPLFSWVRVSIDAGSAEEYARLRRTSETSWGIVWKHVTQLAAEIEVMRKSGFQHRCLLGVGYVVTPDNWQGLLECSRLAKLAGAGYIRLSAMFNPDDAEPYREVYPRILAAVKSAKALHEDKAFTVHQMFTDRLEDLFDGRPDYRTCSYQHYNTYIGGDQNVYRCCVLAYNSRGLLGSVKDRSYADFVADPETQKKLTDFDARGCERCQFNAKNRAMAYLVGEAPTHVEFP